MGKVRVIPVIPLLVPSSFSSPLPSNLDQPAGDEIRNSTSQGGLRERTMTTQKEVQNREASTGQPGSQKGRD